MYVLGFRALLQNRNLRFQVRRLNVRDQSPLESRPQPLFNRRNFLRRAIRRDHNLLLLVIQRVEGVEELFLSTLACRDELNVIHHQHIHGSETIPKVAHAVESQRGNYFIREFLRTQIRQPQGRAAFLQRMPNSLHQVRLAQPPPAIKKQRVVGFRRLFRNGQRSGMSKLVRRAYDEALEGISWVELRRYRIKIESRLGRSGRLWFRLRTNKLNLHLAQAQLLKHCLQELPVRLAQSLPEKPGRYSYHQAVLVNFF